MVPRRILTFKLCHRYTLVVKETIATFREMVAEEQWDKKSSFVVENFSRIPTKVFDTHLLPLRAGVDQLSPKLALIIISRCGFSLPMKWQQSYANSGDETYSYGESLGYVSKNTITRLALPKWVYMLPIKKYVWEVPYSIVGH